jgi:hypothetical protein
MTFQVQQAGQLSIEQMEEFLRGSRRMEFKPEGQAKVYRLIERALRHVPRRPQLRPDAGRADCRRPDKD